MFPFKAHRYREWYIACTVAELVQKPIARTIMGICAPIGLPNWIGRVIAQPLFRQAMLQDLEIMRSQAENIDRFQSEQFVSTELDLMRPHIEYLLGKSTVGSPSDQPLFEKKISIQL
jgi:hypothetical protein